MGFTVSRPLIGAEESGAGSVPSQVILGCERMVFPSRPSFFPPVHGVNLITRAPAVERAADLA